MTNLPGLSREILEAARRGLAFDRAKLDEQIQEVDRLLRGTPPSSAKSPVALPAAYGGKGTPKGTMSAEARQRIADAQRKRWASVKRSPGPEREHSAGRSKKPAAKKASRVVSAESRARMAEAQRKRWASARK